MHRRVTVGLAAVSVVALVVAARWDGVHRDQTVRLAGAVASRPLPATDAGIGRDGALDVALAFVRSSSALIERGPIGRAEVLRSLVTPRLYAGQMAGLDGDIAAIESRLRSSDGRAVPVSALRWVEFPLTATADIRSPGGAVVRVWSVAVFGSTSIDGTRSAWRTFTMTVARRGTTWLVDEVRVELGPAPSEDGTVLASEFREFNQVASWVPVGSWAGGRP